MSAEPSHLSRIETLWSVVRRAHDGSKDNVRAAQQALLERYGGAVRKYLLASLRDADAADEVFQEFALRFARGDFRSADPARGRFRDFVKAALFHLIVDFRRLRGRRLQPLVDVADESAEHDLCDDESFHRSWRQELLDRSWAALAEQERRHGTPFYSALRLLVDDPRRSSQDVAAELTQQRGKPVTAGNLRVLIHRARKLFADELVQEVAQSLDSPSSDDIERELIDLDLLEYCRTALDRLRTSQSAVESETS